MKRVKIMKFGKGILIAVFCTGAFCAGCGI